MNGETKAMQIFSSSHNMAKLKITVRRQKSNNEDEWKDEKCGEFLYLCLMRYHQPCIERKESIFGETQI